MGRKPDPTDLTDAQWECPEPPPPWTGGAMTYAAITHRMLRLLCPAEEF